MSVRSLAVVGHVGPDVREGAMDAPHALAALAALGSRRGCRYSACWCGMSLRDFRQELSPKRRLSAQHVFHTCRHSRPCGTGERHARGPKHHLSRQCRRTRALIAFLVTDCCDGRPEMCGCRVRRGNRNVVALPLRSQRRSAEGTRRDDAGPSQISSSRLSRALSARMRSRPPRTSTLSV